MKILRDKGTKYIYSRSASIFADNPLGVFFPKSEEDIVNIINYAKKHKKSLVFRGAGTSRSGQDINKSIIVDMTKYFNGIIDFDSQKKLLKVQSGVTLKKINDFLKSKGLFFPPDPSSGEYCTIGGMCGNNSGGARALKYGVTRDYIEGIRVILSNEKILNLPDEKDVFFEDLKSFLFENRKKIEKYYPQTVKNSSGYNLKNIFSENDINWHKLFVSSEGTLGAVTEITIKLLPVEKYGKNFLFKAENLTKVISLVETLKKYSPEKIELMGKDILVLSKIKTPLTEKIISSDYQYILLVSFSGNNKEDLDLIKSEIESLTAENIIKLNNKIEFNELFNLRKTAAGYIHRQRDRFKPIPVIEDLQIDFKKFALFKEGIEKILKKYDVRAFFFGHIGDGNIHINTFFDIKEKNDKITAINLKREAHKFIISLGGNLSGEHGDGKLRSMDLELEYPYLYEIFKVIKNTFDPYGIFNPNNIIVKDYSVNYFENLRINTNEGFEVLDKYYKAEIEACNGCGKCRSYCPSFLAEGDERYTTRARLTLLQGLLNTDLTIDDFNEDESVKEILNSCIGCHICKESCPTGVDGGALIFKLKEYLEREYDKIDEIIKNNDFIGKAGSAVAPVSNILLKNKVVKKINEKILGFSSDVNFPEFKKVKFDREKYHYSLATLPDNPVVYFSGCFANYYDTDNEFYATLKTLELMGFNPVLLDFKCCGITKLSKGIPVKEDASYNIEIFRELIKKDVITVTSSPSCRQMLVEMYPFLNLKWRDINLSDYILDIFSFLRKNEKMILNLKKKNPETPFVQYHPPCHTRRTSISEDIKYILEKLGYNVKMLPQNCCGMAGTYGLYRKNLEKSLKIGETQFKLIDENKLSVITECGTCQMQINNNTEQKAVHPIKYVYDLIK